MHRFDDVIGSLVETFSSYDRCFNVGEVVSWADGDVDSVALRQTFLADGRILYIGPSAWGLEYFIPRKAAFRWWSGLNARLAEIGKSRLHERQIAYAMNSLYRFPLWAKPPQSLMEIGLQSGWVAPAWTPGFYVFPIAHLVQQATLPIFRHAMQMELTVRDQTTEGDVEHTSVVEAVETFLHTFGDRVRHIVMARESIPPYEKMTLEVLGSRLGVTRERVRQIENKFWRRLHHPGRWGALRELLQGMISLVSKPGGFVLSTNEEAAPYVRFAAKCLGIPYARIGAGSLVGIGTKGQAFQAQIDGRELVIARHDVKQVATLLNSGQFYFMDHTATLEVAQAIVADAEKRLTKQEKVYLALKQIGKSAHYSEVARVYDQLYPDDEMNEHNIHAILSRCASPDLELHGIVLVGVKGTYGLKQHGYERPGMRLFDTMTKIVEEKYTISQRPVHFNVIVSELGKYRREVNPASLAFATGMNSAIHQIEKDYFVPKGANGATDLEGNAKDLDSILRDFREAHTFGSH